jgi:hypothetical protein
MLFLSPSDIKRFSLSLPDVFSLLLHFYYLSRLSLSIGFKGLTSVRDTLCGKMIQLLSLLRPIILFALDARALILRTCSQFLLYLIINIMVDHKICSDHIGIFRSHLPIFSLGVRRLCVRWVYIQLLCGIFYKGHCWQSGILYENWVIWYSLVCFNSAQLGRSKVGLPS